MRMHMLSGGRLRMRRSLYYPGAPREATFELPVSCALMKHPQGNVLFDTGCHPDVPTDPEGHWGDLARLMAPIYRPQDAVTGQLAKAGLQADDIDIVVCSHLHTDHCGCNAFFRKATVICHAEELRTAQSKAPTAGGYLRADWDVGLPLTTIEAQHDLFSDGRITLIPVPGHTPGMLVAHVVLDADGAFLLASDAVPVRDCLEQRYAPRNSWDMDQTLAALDEIARLEKDGATVLYGHDEAQWLDLRKGEAFYQ